MTLNMNNVIKIFLFIQTMNYCNQYCDLQHE